MAGLSRQTTDQGLQEAFSKFGKLLQGYCPLLCITPLCTCLCDVSECFFFHFLILYALAARVVTDKVSGRSKGFAFVSYATEEEAIKAKEGMDGKVSFPSNYLVFIVVL